MYLHIKKEAFHINYDTVLLLVICSVVLANYIYLWVFYAIIGLYSLNSTLLKADQEFVSRTKTGSYHVTRNAQTARNNEAWRLGKGSSSYLQPGKWLLLELKNHWDGYAGKLKRTLVRAIEMHTQKIGSKQAVLPAILQV